MIVTGLEPAGKGREKVFLDGNAAFVLYGESFPGMASEKMLKFLKSCMSGY